MANVTINKIRKSYDGLEVIHGLDIDIADGEFVALVGPSGCGKSTLLRMVAGLEAIDSGSIAIGERVVNNLPPSERDIAMVFQTYALYPHKSVAENMGFALKVSKTSKSEIDRRVKEAAEILSLTEYLDRKPRHLSGGQRQRVAMGRAIVRDPQVFLFDEPLSNLERKTTHSDANRNQRIAPTSKNYNDLCDPRSDRGHDIGRPNCGHAGWNYRTNWHTA